MNTDTEHKKHRYEGGLRTKEIFKITSIKDPLISIVTVVYNGEAHLEDTINSVINQTYDNVEYIVIDGGSTDATIDIIKKHEDKIDYWISEKDNGIYEAFNKGISLAKGDFIGIQNADDYYTLDAIETVVKEYKINKDIDVFHANMYLHNEEYKSKKLMIASDIKKIDTEMRVNHPTCFVKNSIYKAYKFDTTYKLSADYDFIIKLYLNNFKFKHIDKVLSHMRDGGASSSFYKGEYETFLIRKHHFGLLKASSIYMKKVIKKLIKGILLLVISEKAWIEYRYKN